MSALKSSSRREVEGSLSRISLTGEILDKEETVEVRFDCPKDLFEKIQHAKKLSSVNKKEAGMVSLIREAVELFLQKKDPLLKAERAEERIQKKEESMPQNLQNPSARKSPKSKGRYIPKAIAHKVILRSKGQCEFRAPDGTRCKERACLEIDHLKPYCAGGANGPDNLRVLCAVHNKFSAAKTLGQDFMNQWRAIPITKDV